MYAFHNSSLSAFNPKNAEISSSEKISSFMMEVSII